MLWGFTQTIWIKTIVDFSCTRCKSNRFDNWDICSCLICVHVALSRPFSCKSWGLFASSVCSICSRSMCSLICVISLCSSALDAALEFQQQFVVPSTWKTEVKEESSSSEDDDDDGEEEQEEDASGEEEEVEEEARTYSSPPQPLSRATLLISFFFFFFLLSCFLSEGGSGAVPRGAGELSAAALQVYGRQRWAQCEDKTLFTRFLHGDRI